MENQNNITIPENLDFSLNLITRELHQINEYHKLMVSKLKSLQKENAELKSEKEKMENPEKDIK